MSTPFDPFGAAAMPYFKNGYLPIPLPLGEKSPPPKGTPNSIEVTKREIKQWRRSGEFNVGCVVPDGVLVVDVDGDKKGARRALKEVKRRLGKLPPTWRVQRSNRARYHLWYSVPAGTAWPGQMCPGVDLIYRHYRYVLLPPSLHPDGDSYQWLRPDGSPADHGEFPSFDELTPLPQAYIDAFSIQGGYTHRERADVDSRLWMKQHGRGEPCTVMTRVLKRHQKLIRKAVDPGGLHQAMTDAVWALCAEVGAGHAGGRRAFRKLRKTWMLMAEESGRRSEREAEAEWERACLGAVEKTAVESVRDGDPCNIGEDEQPDPDLFFEKGKGVKILTLKREVEKAGKMELDHTGEVYRFSDTGVWVPQAEREIARRTIHLLGERFRPEHAKTIEFMVRAQEPRFTDENLDTRYLNLPNGLLDWRTGTLVPHDPMVNSLIRIPTNWNPNAKAKKTLKWLKQVFPADAIEFAIEVIGYCLYYDNPLHKAILLYGSGRNGKSTYLRLIEQLIGRQNVTSRSPQDLDASQFQAISLYGKLANLAGDVDPHVFKSTEKFKKLTGGDTFTAERKHHGRHYEFRCRAKTIAAFNQLPRTRDTTEGFFSKWIVVPFTQFFDKPIPDLILKLTTDEELEGLLVLAVQGLQRLMARGRFEIPPSVAKATEEFRMIADPVHAFVDECIEQGKGFTPRQDVYDSYQRWCILNNHYKLSARQFYERFIAVAAPRAVTRHGTRGYRDIKVRF